MRKARVYFRDEEAGILTQLDDGTFTFRYHDVWMRDSSKPAISLTLPKSRQEFQSPALFPFFFSLLPEGTNKQLVCKLMRIDPADHFGLLITTAKTDPVGAVRIVKMGVPK